jgi:hypothetical protein
MNERIKELAEQARQYAFAKVELTQDPTEWSSKYYNEMFDQKFAKLIVRECLKACSRANEIRYSVPPTKGQVVVSCMREIEKHFGVEQ